jgi:hypothetical protein
MNIRHYAYLLVFLLSSCGTSHGAVIEDRCHNYVAEFGPVGGVLGSFNRKTYEDGHSEEYGSSEFSCAERYGQALNP